MRTQEANAGLSTMTSDEDRAQGSRVMTAEFHISVLRSLVAGEAGAPRAEGAWLGFAGEYAGGAGEAEAGGGKEGGTNRGGEEAPAPATAEAVQATAAEPVQAKLMQPAAAVEPACPNKGIQEDPPQQQGGLTRRAAANVLSRVKDSESRLKSEFPSWMHSHIMNPANKSELITLIKESGGELKAVQAKLEITLKEEMVKSNMAKSSMIPLTEVEIIGKYGEAEAAKVMQQKVKDRLTVPDPNRSGGLLYLMQQDTTEYKRGSKQTWGMFGQMEAANVAPSDLEGFMSGYNVGACKIEDGAPAPPATPPRSHEPATTSPSPSPAMPAAPAVPSNPPPAAPVATGKAVPSAPAAAAIPEVKEAPLDPPPRWQARTAEQPWDE